MAEFWDMGGYGAYVWSSYGIALVVLLFNAVEPYWRLRRTERRIARGTAREDT